MKAVVTKMSGFEDAIVAMYLSKRTWTPELDKHIRDVCKWVLDYDGKIKNDCNEEDLRQFNEWLSMLLRMGKKHITILRYINISIMTEGIHRAGQDDIDSHAKRFDNRIVRSSTRLADYSEGEMSEYYQDKIIPTDVAVGYLDINLPDSFRYNGSNYVKSPNGYVKEAYKNNKDVKRGLYMLSIPSNFVSQINLCEWGHVFHERNQDGTANPEVKLWAESVMKDIESFHEQITRDYVLSIKN